MKQKFMISCIAAALLIASFTAKAQLNPLGAGYYLNPYLNNPAMAGINNGLNINMAFRQQWSSIPGTPVSQALTADYGFARKVGIGLIFYADKAGLQRWTHMTATYAYHLPLNENNQQLHFGISMGFFQERLDDQNVIGNPDDVSIGRYNQRETYLDGDLGVAYSGSKLSLQGSLPNLKRFFKQDEQENTVDRSVFFASAGYKLLLESKENGFNIEPKACFRGVKGYDNILDLGCSMNIEDNRIQLFGMYHTSRSATYGMGFQYKSMAFSGIYTTETSVLRGYTEGSFEVNLRLQF